MNKTQLFWKAGKKFKYLANPEEESNYDCKSADQRKDLREFF